MIINILNLPVFYINLKEEKIKSKETRETLKSLGFKDIRRFDAILGKDKKEGCAMSHQAILKEINIDGPFIIFEDDIEINDSFNPIINVPEDADAVYLGLSAFALNNNKTDQDLIADRVDDSIYRIYNMLAAHAILYIQKDYYRFISKAIDAMLKANRNQDNARADTMKYFNVYALNHPLFYQGEKHRKATRFDLSTAKTRPYKKQSRSDESPIKISKIKDWKLEETFLKNPPKIHIVVLSWKRPQGIIKILNSLGKQTYKNFSVHISNGSPENQKTLEQYANRFRKIYKIAANVSNDGNDLRAFRRLVVAKELAEAGAEIIFYIDDDVLIPNNYVQMALSQYKPKTYFSNFAWSLHNNGKDYYKHRTRVWDNKNQIQYCGTGISMIDAKIFLEAGLTDVKKVPSGAYGIEDLWLSYYADKVLGWDLKYMDAPGVVLGGNDAVALYKEIKKESYDKADFLRDLVKMGWNIPETILRSKA
jgi:GR25 family glycosyltransferase involved in LPS biosynthesis